MDSTLGFQNTLQNIMMLIPLAAGASGFLIVGTFFAGTTFFAISGTLKILVTFSNIKLKDEIYIHINLTSPFNTVT